MTLEVIGAGFGRTGTMSMKLALEQLGYVKTHHMSEVMPNKAQRAYWHHIGAGGTPDWDVVFEGFRACVDFPSSTYYNELLAHFPDAKVVLNIRDADRWYKSASETIMAMPGAIPGWAKKYLPMFSTNDEMVKGTVWNRVFDGRQDDPEHAKQVFNDYIEQVKADVPANKLLVFEVKDGWKPLCEFLGKDVPDTPFPHVNDSAQFKKMIRNMRLFFAAIHALMLAIFAFAIWWLFF